MKIDHFKIIFKIMAPGANDRQFYPELRTVLISCASSLDFSAFRFKVMVTSLPTFQGPKFLQIY